MARTTKTTGIDACEALLRLSPKVIDEPLIRAIVGRRTVRTQAEVGRAFGLTSTHIRADWSPSGMPGERGKYDLGQIVAWRLRRQQEKEEKQSRPLQDTRGSELERMAREAEVRKLQAQAERAELDLETARGRMMDVGEVEAAMSSVCAAYSEHMLSLPHKFATLMSEEQAAEVVPAVEADIKRLLATMAGELARKVLAPATTE
jgi:hypothetical protein